MAEYRSLHKMMLWDSHYPKASTNFAISQASTFYTRTPTEHNDMSLVHTHSTLPVPNQLTYVTREPTPPSICQPSPESATPTGNSTPRNNPPKLVPYIPIETDSDPSLLYYSPSDSY